MQEWTAAAIDVGTNTVRMLVARVAPGRPIVRLSDHVATVRLGYGVDATGRLDLERMERAAETVSAFAAIARDTGCAWLGIAATSAVRDAANAAMFVDLIHERTGLTMEVISGEREALLTFAGALHGWPHDGVYLVADVGGGSTEVIVGRGAAPLSAQSLRLGSGRLTEQWLASDPPTEEECARAADHARRMLKPVASMTLEGAVVVGGTASALCGLGWTRNLSHFRLLRTELGAVLQRLRAYSAARTAAESGLDPARARVLPAGVIIIAALMDHLGLDHVEVSQGGLREGLILEWLASAAKAGET